MGSSNILMSFKLICFLCFFISGWDLFLVSDAAFAVATIPVLAA